jgi:hypothetical protein
VTRGDEGCGVVRRPFDCLKPHDSRNRKPYKEPHKEPPKSETGWVVGGGGWGVGGGGEGKGGGYRGEELYGMT